MLNRFAIIGLFLCGLLAALPTAAKNIYKYQDENGIWYFTDKAPDEDIPFETVYMEREREDRIHLRQQGTKQNPLYYVFNDYWGPVQVEMKLTEAVNILTEPELPARFVIPGQKERLLLGLGALDPQLGFQYRLNLAAVPGPPGPVRPEKLVLKTPFPEDQAYIVSQGFNGEKTHGGDDSTYAIDIAMPENSMVHAVRDGIVMDVEEDFNKGGTDLEKYADKANHVRVLHADGTMALYAHLGLAGVIVRPGARVRAGQAIGRSGNTGFSSGPHLHFVIQQNIGMKLVSLPFEFELPGGGSAPPVQGKFVGSVPGAR
ncbi:MAG: M23 family metallopeptidase [Xanthomonadales bacterium]|jgi:murein DD-endopeptidase MepM/ murein hydrolase activator NlpD|nr:M23 family metallopeptidase [Xanthomonadales bacterium]